MRPEMDAIALHTELRNALSLSDELGRHEHALGRQNLAAELAVLRTTLSELERSAGQTHRFVYVADAVTVWKLESSLSAIREHAEEIPIHLRPRVVMLMEAVERIIFAEKRPAATIPSKPVLGVLPLARVIPQDVHSVGDYFAAGMFLATALLAKTARARSMGLLLGAAQGGVALATDMKLSLAKVIPIEVHEVLDHAAGVKACAAPFVLGYAKKDPIASAIQIATGLGLIAISLFTDYRGARGVTMAHRSKGGPRPRRDRLPKNVRNRVPEVQRPLEGFAGPSYIPSLHTAEG